MVPKRAVTHVVDAVAIVVNAAIVVDVTLIRVYKCKYYFYLYDYNVSFRDRGHISL